MTTRHGGVSSSPYKGFNLGKHVGDDTSIVQQNRDHLETLLDLPSSPVWMNQVHGIDVLTLPHEQPSLPPTADASYSNNYGQVCVVMTADCLPILLCNKQGSEISAIHAGWRGLCSGVIEASLGKFESKPKELIAYLGPAIGRQAFEVGPEVKQAFVDKCWQDECYFKAFGEKYLADIQGLALARLNRAGINTCYLANTCTYTHPDDFFSYRRDGTTGRMASLIWRK